MKFAPFDLDLKIKWYNYSENKTTTRSHFSFLRALSPEMIKAFNLALILYKYSRNFGAESFSSKEAVFLETVISQLQDKEFQDSHFSEYKLDEDSTKTGPNSWHLQQQKILKDQSVWNDILSTTSKPQERTRLNSLRELWRSNATHYACHSNDALWFVSNNIAGFFEKYYSHAESEYRWYRRKIPHEVSIEYQEYLENEKSKMAKLRIELCQAMLLRLQLAAATNNITYGDHIHYTSQFIHHNALYDFEFGQPSQINTISPEHFQHFVQHILKNGDETQQTALCNLGLFKCDDEYIAWRNSKSLLLVPKTFHKRKLVPNSQPWFPRIFYYRNFRYEFMEKNVWLFSSIRTLQKYPIGIDNLIETINHIKSMEIKLGEANSEIQKIQLGTFQSFLHHSTSLFILEWIDYFTDAQINITKKKIAILIKLYGHYEEHKTLNIDFKIISQLIHEVSESITNIPLSVQETEKFHIAKANLLRIKCEIISAPHKKSSHAMPTTQSCRTTQSKSTYHPSNPFCEKHTEKNLPNSTATNNPFDESFAAPPKTDSSLFALIFNIKLFEMEPANFDKLISEVSTTMQAKLQEKSPESEQAIEKTNNELFKQLINHCTNLKSHSEYEKYQEKFIALEQLLLRYPPKHIQERIQYLASLRDRKNFWFLYQLKCRSYIASFENKNGDMATNLITNSALFTLKPVKKHDEPPAPHEILSQ